MALYLFSVAEVWSDGKSLVLEKGVRMSELSALPEKKEFIQGIVLELRFPNGVVHRTFLLQYGVGVEKQDDGFFLMEKDPFVRFSIPLTIKEQDILVGTEVWWLIEEKRKTEEERNLFVSELARSLQATTSDNS